LTEETLKYCRQCGHVLTKYRTKYPVLDTIFRTNKYKVQIEWLCSNCGWSTYIIENYEEI